MGKGRRNREKLARRREECEQLRISAAKADSRARWLGLTACILTALAVAFQFLLQSVMRGELNRGAYESINTDVAEINALRSILPIGAIGLVLLLLGTAAVAWFLYRQKPWLSLIGCGLSLAGAGFFIPYVYRLGLLFPFDPLVGVNGRGLDFTALLCQHYSALFPLVLLIPAVAFSFYAMKKRDVADIMQSVNDDSSTLMLDEE